MIILGGVLLFALVLATHSNANFENQYQVLLALNISTIVIMVLLIIFLGVWLRRRFHTRVFGTRLMTRFALSFALLGAIPSILLFLISTAFVSRTIDTWFNLKLEPALEAGISFGREHLNYAQEQTKNQLKVIIDQSTEQYHQINATKAQELLTEHRLQTLAALDKKGQVLWRFNAKGYHHEALPVFTAAILNKANQGWDVIEDESDASDQTDTSEKNPESIKIHALKAIPGNQTAAYLYVKRIMRPDFSNRIKAIQSGLRDYQATSSSRSSLKNLYRVTLTITLLVTSLAALAAAFLISNRMIKPILWLAQATKMVASGHYALIPQRVKGSDELIQLVDSFGSMAQQLNVTQSFLRTNQKELEAAKAYSEAILQNLSAGVLVLNHDMTLNSYNAYSSRMFQADLLPQIGQHINSIEPFTSFYDAINNAIKQHNQQPWRIQQNIQLNSNTSNEDLIVSIQGTNFISEDGLQSYVLVFDDISTIISAQRTLAWAEVAQRLAHEIKNPLTPIQLSAERLQMKLTDKLDENDQNLLERSTRTIVNQVQALQNMVNDFRDFAHTPEVTFSAVNLNGLIEELLVLYESGQGDKYLIQSDLDDQNPLILADEQQLRQVLHNLIKNSLEAAPIDRQCIIKLQTKSIQPSQNNSLNSCVVSFTLKDNGIGFSQKIMARMFEPYNTSKNSGTGLGLPVVKKIIDAHNATINIRNYFTTDEENNPQNKILGAQIDIQFLKVAET